MKYKTLVSHWVPRITLNEHYLTVLGYLWPYVYFSLITLLFPVAILPFPSLCLLVEAVMSSMYALLVTRKHNSLWRSFCQIVLIIFRLYKNIIKFAPFISLSILSVAFMCQIWILNLFSLQCLFCIIIILLTFNFVEAQKKFENQTFNHLIHPPSTNSFS